WGRVPAAGAVAGIGNVANVPCMIVANDATVKAGAFFPQTVKKLIRAQRIAFENNLPLIYLVDSAGVFLPMQDEIFPDEDDFGRIFRNNSVISAAGIPQFAAIMGNCVAGGAYLPVLCDKILMTEGSGLYLAGPSMVTRTMMRAIYSPPLSTPTLWMSTKLIMARPWSQLMRESAGARSVLSPASVCKCAQRRKGSKWAASFIRTAPTKPRAS